MQDGGDVLQYRVYCLELYRAGLGDGLQYRVYSVGLEGMCYSIEYSVELRMEGMRYSIQSTVWS